MRNRQFYFYTCFAVLCVTLFAGGCENSSASKNSQLTPSSQANTSQVESNRSESRNSESRNRESRNSEREGNNRESRNENINENRNEDSNIDKLALANHLQSINARFYGAYWCPFCNRQKELFGKEAFRRINYIECDPGGENPQPQQCESARIESIPTWVINGKQYPGFLSLEQLAENSGYNRSR